MSKRIKNTEFDAQHPWPEDMLLQGGTHGVVFSRDPAKPHYETAFVEAFPMGTFLRGEGKTVHEAEDACWAQHQAMQVCKDGHGPYEARHYENGSGFCVGCGTWFSNVLEPPERVKIERLACDRVQTRWGADVVLLRKWEGLVADEEATLTAVLHGEPIPARTTADPTPEELAEASRPPSPDALATLLAALGGGEQ